MSNLLGNNTAVFETCNNLGIGYTRAGDLKKAIHLLKGGIGGPDLCENEVPGRVVGLNR